MERNESAPPWAARHGASVRRLPRSPCLNAAHHSLVQDEENALRCLHNSSNVEAMALTVQILLGMDRVDLAKCVLRVGLPVSRRAGGRCGGRGSRCHEGLLLQQAAPRAVSLPTSLPRSAPVRTARQKRAEAPHRHGRGRHYFAIGVGMGELGDGELRPSWSCAVL